MKIAVDLDDVLASSLKSFVEFYNEEYCGNLKVEDFRAFTLNEILKVEDFRAFTLNEIIGISVEEEQKIMEKYDESEYFENIKPLKGARGALEKLSKDYEVIIVTSRPQKREEQTRRWLKKNNFCFSDVFFIRKEYVGESKTKGEVCEELGVDVLIEDNLDYAMSCVKKGISVLLFDYPYNQFDYLDSLIKRVYSWDDVLEFFD